MWIFRLLSRVLEENNGGGGGDAGAGGGNGSGTGGDNGQAGQGQGSIMNRGSSGAGAGGQGGAAGASGAGAAGDQGQAGGQGDAGGGDGGGDQTWNWMEGMPGSGERPPWLKADKYKTVEAQARAAAELETKLGPAAELIGAPEGDYELPGLSDEQKTKIAGEFDPEDPLLKMLGETAKRLGLSQKAYNEIAVAGAMTIAEINAKDEAALADALAALGSNVDARVDAVNRAVEQLVGKDGLQAIDEAVGNSPQAFAALEKIVAKAAGDAGLAGAGAGGGPAFSKADVEAEQFKVFPQGHPMAGKSMYDNDKEHRAKVDRMWKQLFPGEDRQEVG